MSADSAIFSDDDRPLAARSSVIGMNHANGSKTNGHVKEEEDYEMSESNDEPLVSYSHIIFVQFILNLIFCMLTSSGLTQAWKDFSKKETGSTSRILF